MARLVSILAGAGIRLDGRARFPEQGQPSKASSAFQTWLRQSCFEFRLAAISRSRHRAQSGAPSSGNSLSSSRREGSSSIADRRPRRANWLASGPHPAFRISRRIFAFEDFLRDALKERSEDHRSGEFRRELCVDVAGVAKAFPREVAAGRTARLRRAVQAALAYYLCYCEAGFRSGMIDVGLYSIQHRRA